MNAVLLAFAFFVQDLPAGEVTLSDDGQGHYRYTAVHRFIAHGGYRQRTFEKAFLLDAEGRTDGRVPVSRWLALRPKSGCTDAVDERSGETGRVCAQDEGAQGTVFGKPFLATYEGGQLATLTLGSVRFGRGRAPLPTARPASAGFPVSGAQGVLAVEPAVALKSLPDAPPDAAAAALAHAVHHRVSVTEPAADCVAYAKALVGELRGMQLSPRVVYGLVEDGGRAYPHAWVSVTRAGVSSEVDPALERPVRESRYLALDPGRAGSVYLDLLEGRRRVVRHVIR